jgi:hypothetical protein
MSIPARTACGLIGCVVALVLSAPARAGVIDAFTTNSAVTYPGGLNLTTGATNSAAHGGNNYAFYDVKFTAYGSIDQQVHVASSLGTTGYDVGPYFKNSTGTAWHRFRVELGFDTGANFQPLASIANLPASLQLLLNSAGASQGFNTNYDTFSPTGNAPSMIEWMDNITTPNKGLSSAELAFDVPDLAPTLIASLPTDAQDPNNASDYYLTFRYTAIPSPEPATLGVLALGGALMLTRRQRRHA